MLAERARLWLTPPKLTAREVPGAGESEGQSLMELKGLFLIGSFKSHGMVTRRDGTIVDGFHEIQVDRGSPFPMKASFSEVDFDSGEPTHVWGQLQELKLQPGENIAVKVITKASG